MFLLGIYTDLQETNHSNDYVIRILISSKDEEKYLKAAFDSYDLDGNGVLSFDELAVAFKRFNHICMTDGDIVNLFHELDEDGSGCIDFDEFKKICTLDETKIILPLVTTKDRDKKGLAQVLPSNETYFGESIVLGMHGKRNADASDVVES